MTRYVGVIGTSTATPDEAATAYQLGRELARAGWVVVCGGRGGVMDAACRGVRDGGGTSIGILPGERADPHTSEAATITLPTGMGEMRNALIIRASEVVVAVGGAWGTLSEIALALTAGVPVVGLGTWELPRPGIEAVSTVEQALAAVRRCLPD